MFGVSIQDGTCLSSWRQLGRWSLSSIHLPPLTDPLVEFVPLADQSSEVADRPPQVNNEDSPVVITSGGGGADEDKEVMQIDNLAGVLSSD